MRLGSDSCEGNQLFNFTKTFRKTPGTAQRRKAEEADLEKLATFPEQIMVINMQLGRKQRSIWAVEFDHGSNLKSPGVCHRHLRSEFVGEFDCVTVRVGWLV